MYINNYLVTFYLLSMIDSIINYEKDLNVNNKMLSLIIYAG